MAKEPLVTRSKAKQVKGLIESELNQLCVSVATSEDLDGYHGNNTLTISELQQKLSQSHDKKFYLFKVLRAHILPLTNVAFNKSGSWWE